MSYNAKRINHHGTEVDLFIKLNYKYCVKKTLLIATNKNILILELF